MRLSHLIILALALGLAACAAATPTPAPTLPPPSPAPPTETAPPAATPTPAIDRAAAWSEDLDVFAEHVLSNHSYRFQHFDRATWQAEVEALRARIPELSDETMLLELQRLVALLNDGHSGLPIFSAESGVRHYPLRLYLFSDGLYVIGAHPDYAEAIGARVISIGGLSAEEAYERMKVYVPADNEYNRLLTTPAYLVMAEALYGAGIIASMEQPDFLIEAPDGRQFTLNPAPLPQPEAMAWLRERIEPASENYLALDFEALLLLGLMQRPEPVYLSQRYSDDFWYSVFEDSNTLYMQYNDTFSNHFVEASQIRDLVEANPVERVILDLRHNPGGDVTTSLDISRLLREPALNPPGGLYILIGRQTFSAAVLMALDIEAETGVIFVGEPTGGGMINGGGAIPETLPNSRLRVFISQEYHNNFDAANPRDAILPQIAVPLSAADYFAGRDPVLEAALTYQP